MLTVAPDQRLIDAFEASDAMVLCDCRRGECGLCSIPVKSGDIVHRDTFLSENEKASAKVMQACVSRGRGRLALDL